MGNTSDQFFSIFQCLYNKASTFESLYLCMFQLLLHFTLDCLPTGNYGNTLDKPEEREKLADSDSESEMTTMIDTEREKIREIITESMTKPKMPETTNKQYYQINWGATKPCLHIKFPWEEHRRRLYNTNLIERICMKLVRLRIFTNFVINI